MLTPLKQGRRVYRAGDLIPNQRVSVAQPAPITAPPAPPEGALKATPKTRRTRK